ncbi:GCN5 family acetyltransferase [Terrabacter sp. Soil811]|uniref:GCN5 family acetyltransferase n=1 Tax=Terrabacter sp. Soil811 TaxID=1736419 RepID=UPI0006F56CEE|nr:GCN5 family acetyltransferase [Terrabacter sp. Soil811]KRF45013.1 GCN5 family acetyltransferase [Terrabacter sp. Soil811]
MEQTTDSPSPPAEAAEPAEPPVPPVPGWESLGLDRAAALALAETAEAEFMIALHDGAPAEAKAALGMRSERLAGGVAVVTANDPTGGYWNKALGFGVTEPVTDSLVAHLVDLYASAGAPALCLQVAPAALPADWDDICVRHGIVGGSVWAKLLRPAAAPTTPSTTDLRVGTIGPEDAETYARVFAGGFGMPPEPHLLSMFAAAGGGGPGFTAYGAWDGAELVAAANLHVAGPAAAFCGAATLPEARGRGAQSAFMKLRVEAARAAGCTWMSAETWQELEGAHNPSLHNMLRSGFVEVYDRRNWVWRPGA